MFVRKQRHDESKGVVLKNDVSFIYATKTTCKTFWKTDSKTLNNPFKIIKVQKEDSFGTHFILLLHLRLGLTECILGTPLSRSSFLLFFPSHHHSRRRDDFIHIDVCLLRARRPTPHHVDDVCDSKRQKELLVLFSSRFSTTTRQKNPPGAAK